MAANVSLDSPYEGSDEASESELLDQSLSVWKGWGCIENEAFVPIPLDLHTASSIGQYDCVKNIVERGEEDLNKQNKGGWTPLMYACYIGHDNIVHVLIKAGVDVNIQNFKGQTPLILAASCGNESVGYFLLQAGAELECRDRKGWTALFHATYSGHQNMAKFLLDSGADSEAREPMNGFTPFMEAAATGHEIIVQYFLQHGVDVEAKAYSGHTARSLALDNGRTKIVSLIDNHILSPSVPLRSDAGLSLEGDLSSSDDGQTGIRRTGVRGQHGRYKGPSIRDGPEALNRVFDKAKKRVVQHKGQGHSDIPACNDGYVDRFQPMLMDDYSMESDRIRFRDVTSPIGPEDHSVDTSGKESLDIEEDGNAFTKTGALTIKSSSGSSGGLVAALGLSRNNSESDHGELADQESSSSETGLQRSLSDSVLKGFENLRSQERSDIPRHSDGGAATDNVDGFFTGGKPLGNPEDFKQYTPFGGMQELFPGGIPQSNSRPVQGQKPSQNPPNYQLSMLQHPLWQEYGYAETSEKNPPVTRTTNTKQKQGRPSAKNSERATAPANSKQLGTSASNKSQGNDKAKPGKTGLSKQAQMEQREIMKGRPTELNTLLEELSLSKYLPTFEEQDVDLQVFLSLTDNDLKEVGIKLFGPRRKMANAIARWHSNARPSSNDLEQAYADKLEADMQEMAIQLKLAKEEVAQLKQQVRQEAELRSVTESCLVRDRVTWQQVRHLAGDSQQRCAAVQERLSIVRLYQLALARRVGISPQSSLSGSGSRAALRAAFKDGFSLDENQPIPAEISKLSTQQLLSHIDKMAADMESLVSIATMNNNKVMQSAPTNLPGFNS